METFDWKKRKHFPTGMRRKSCRFFYVRIESSVSLALQEHQQVHFQKSVGAWGTLQLLCRSDRWEAEMHLMLWSGCHCHALLDSYLGRYSWVPLWKMCWESDKRGIWSTPYSQQGEALKEAVLKTVVRELNPNYKQDPRGHLEILTLGPWIQVRAKNGYKKTCR